MPDRDGETKSTLALSTKVEEDFIAPLTAIRGALEILRDYPDIGAKEHARFVSSALSSCQRLERSVHDLADTVYDAAEDAERPVKSADAGDDPHADRIEIIEDQNIIELDFSELVFKNSSLVNDVFDTVERIVERSGRKWFFIINMENCRIWPEAWVAFAHRGKKLKIQSSYGMVRYSSDAHAAGPGSAEEDLVASRTEAIEVIRSLTSHS